MAVAYHAVRRGEVGKRDVAIVIGCGPVGLGVILMLKAQGVRTRRRQRLLAGPPRARAAPAAPTSSSTRPTSSPYTAAGARGTSTTSPTALELAVGTSEKLGRLPVGWWHAWRLADALGVEPKHPVIFECVGVPGVIDSIIDGAPLFSARRRRRRLRRRRTRSRPAMAINKEIDLRFVIGYTPLEFRDTLHMLADGKVDPRPLITGTVGLDGVGAAFDALGDPEAHAKILVDPRSTATTP